MPKTKLSKEHFLAGDIRDKSDEFKQGVMFGANNTLQEASLLIQSKFGRHSSAFSIVDKILSDMRVELREE